ncbi:hypothetical protein CAMRE0001_1057 [Campylobacter rectus RM3267]|uniref:Uncharacterized protein n=1 Tax=Campylobacter rectus RM3267 TaxID=553218 RepID=B9D629_CAMRE|nr:hypothetical protein CAMRE0001_1057 [Campylobacter rectus RM3267]
MNITFVLVCYKKSSIIKIYNSKKQDYPWCEFLIKFDIFSMKY